MYRTFALVVSCCFFFFSSIAVATPLTRIVSASITYQYPIKNAQEVSLQTAIGLRAAEPFDRSSLGPNNITVTGSISGPHVVSLVLAMNGRMAIFKPVKAFSYGETVSVSFSAELTNEREAADTFFFTTMSHAPRELSEGERMRYITDGAFTSPLVNAPLDVDTSMPVMAVNTDLGATPGRVFMTNFGFGPIANGEYLLILDEHGNVLKRKLLSPSYGLGFALQPNGMFTYFDYSADKYYGLDTNLNIIDSFMIAPNSSDLADGHELLLLPDSGYMLIAVSITYQDMSEQVTGGETNAEIEGGIIEEFDKDRNEIFEWRGIDHFSILDAIHEDLTAPLIDFEHANAIDLDSMGEIFLSSRHLSEITKIDRETGNIIWHLGGLHNQFTFVGDTEELSYQHDVRLLPGGHMTIFDNGNFHTPQVSRAVEFAIDEQAMTATLVWQFHHDPEVYGMAMGDVERLPNGNTLIGWGSTDETMTEVTPNNSVVFDLSMAGGNFSYRALKYPISLSASVAVSGQSNSPSLVQNYPNPFKESTTINFTLAHPEEITIRIYDAAGELRETVPEGQLSEGPHTVVLDVKGLPSGAYFYTASGPDFTTTHPMTIER